MELHDHRSPLLCSKDMNGSAPVDHASALLAAIVESSDDGNREQDAERAHHFLERWGRAFVRLHGGRSDRPRRF